MKNHKCMALLLVLIMLFAMMLSACGNKNTEPETKTPAPELETNAPTPEPDPTPEPVEEVFVPQGDEISSTAGTISVLAPSDAYDMWKDIDWRITPSENNIVIDYSINGYTRFYVKVSATKPAGKFDTIEKLEAALQSGDYAEWASYESTDTVTIGDHVLYDCVKADKLEYYNHYIMIKDGKFIIIETTIPMEEFREVFDNLVLQAVMTVESTMEY